MEKIMKVLLIRNILSMVMFGLFTQFSVAQDVNPGRVAATQVAHIVASIEHFPSDDDKAALAMISGNDKLPQGVRDMAMAVSNIAHETNDEGKAAMMRLQASENAPDRAKTLAGIIGSFNHMVNDETKETIAQLYP